MSRYVITSPKFEGQLSFSYDENNVLTEFVNEANLSIEILKFFHVNFPVVEKLLEELAGNSKTLKIRLVTNKVTFDQFWESYNLKIDKQDAQKAFNKLSEAEQVQAFENIPSYNYYLMKREGQHKMYPATYLHGKFANDYKALAKS